MTTIQGQLHDSFCWGCGADNPDGLHLQTEWEGDETVSRWTGAPRYAAGPRHFLNGGIIATLLDCHGVCTAIADAYRREGREIGSEPQIWHATTGMVIEYLRPTAIDAEVEIRATVASLGPEGTTVQCVLAAGGKPRARATVTSRAVPESWRQPPPR